jgi:DNA repair exonuclease SbcCD nuclease subunit
MSAAQPVSLVSQPFAGLIELIGSDLPLSVEIDVGSIAVKGLNCRVLLADRAWQEKQCRFRSMASGEPRDQATHTTRRTEVSMSGHPFRFLHASDFHLELPLRGIEEVPDQLRELFCDAPYLAAEHVFDTALAEQVDFVLLAGDITKLKGAGARPLEFLYNQFQRLHEAQIAVYWCDSGFDRLEYWPSAVPLPANVTLFTDDSVDVVTHRRDGEVLATLLGCAGIKSGRIRPEEFDNGAAGYVIALTHGKTEAAPLEAVKVDYWALGGKHNRDNLMTEPSLAHYCGSPQARDPEEEGAHGCAVVAVDGRGRTHRQTMTTDVVRWHTEVFELPDQIDQHGLLRMMRDHCHRQSEQAAGRQVLLRWRLTDSDQLTDTRSDLLAARVRQGGLARDLLTSLRAEFGEQIPGVWPVDIEAEPPTVLPSGWYEEDTVLGDLLRIVQAKQAEPVPKIALDPMSASESKSSLAPKEADELVIKHLGSELQIHDAHESHRLLKHIASLGVDLLRGDRILSEEAESKS